MTSEKRQLPEAVYPDPRTLYIRDDRWPRETWLRQYSGPIIGATFSGACVALYNYANKRPLRAGIHMYFIIGSAGSIIGYYVRKKVIDYFAFRDQVFKHYIATHPEDFPPPERRKVGEHWYPWIPIR